MRISLHESNDEKEFRKLYEEYYAPFCIYAKRFINDMAICEDIVSDVFASLWDKRNSIELKKDTATAYLKICVRNSCLNYLKHLEYEWNYNELCQKQPPVYATESDSVYTLNELYDMLFKALERLPQNYRIVFTKNFFEGKTHQFCEPDCSEDIAYSHTNEHTDDRWDQHQNALDRILKHLVPPIKYRADHPGPMCSVKICQASKKLLDR